MYPAEPYLNDWNAFSLPSENSSDARHLINSGAMSGFHITANRRVIQVQHPYSKFNSEFQV